MKRFLLLALTAGLLSPIATLSLQGGAIAETFYEWSEDPMDDEKSLLIGLREENKKALIIIGCYPAAKAEYNLAGEIHFSEFIRSEYEKTGPEGRVKKLTPITNITWRFDKQEPVTDKKYISVTKPKNLYIRSSESGKNQDVKYFIDWFLKSDVMLLRYEGWDNGVQTLRFNVSELKPLIERGEKEGCDWGRGINR